ncbi:MAG TPA: MG2 domain-containing protein, partial [Clostridia bacterium]|nr:MG2 domain-containing protein [Clostridia bacterium]
FLAHHNGQSLASASDFHGHDRVEEPRPAGQTVFFTDRAIYRPGQTIHYKGICLWTDQAKDNYELLKGESVTVIFRDQNGKEIARQKHRANDYGSFSGSFTAPRDRVTGQMSIIAAESRAQGATTVSVEEYKRPKFEVTLDAPSTAPKLNDKVTLKGTATAYTGAAIDGATVQYRVVRQVQMPWWWGYWRGGHSGESQEIAHGTLQTQSDGSFTIEFIARPDLKVPEKDEPTFTYSVTADVTDSTGETRSDNRDLRVGYTALEARMHAEDWQVAGKPLVIQVTTTTLDGEPQVAEGAVKVYELVQPPAVQRLPIGGEDADFDGWPDEDLSSMNKWPLGKIVAEKGFTTDTNGTANLSFPLPGGAYRAVIETQDRFGKAVTGLLPIQVLQPEAPKLDIKVAHLLAAPLWTVEPGQEFIALWGTGYDTGRAFVEIEHRRKVIQRYWTRPGQTQQQIKLPITEALRGGFTVHITQVRENRSYLVSRRVDVPWSNKDLKLRWEHFVSKLQPGQKETWTLQIQAPDSGPANAEKFAAETVAALYDASLDAFAPHHWPAQFNFFRQDHSFISFQYANMPKGFQHALGRWDQARIAVAITYRSFPPDLTQHYWINARFRRARGFGGFAAGRAELSLGAPLMDMPAASAGALVTKAAPARQMFDALWAEDSLGSMGEPAQPKVDLSQVSARKNLNETAFFFPHLMSDSNGVVRITFTMPEALTRWRFLGFAHDPLVRSGLLEGETVTSKDLMVQPNPPRFLREGDTVEFTVKVSNQSDKSQSGQVRLTFADARTGEPADHRLGNTKSEQSFEIPARESRGFSWRITVPDGSGFLTYKAVAATAALSDGEEGAVPVLSRRILITESITLPIRGPATKKFEFTKLLKSGSSKTLQHQNLTAQMVSNPAWYAVLALPYLMEYPYECSEQVFNRLYANALARTIAASDPKIHRVFEQWRNTPALDSPLEKNEELKSVMLEETPWLRQANDESQARRNVGILFDDNRLNSETERTLQKLTEMQLQDGAWPWFPGGPGNDFITLYITTGFGRMRHLGVDINVAPAIRSLQRLDAWMTERYLRIQERPDPDKYVPSSTDALYLYGRSFFLKDMPIGAPHLKAIEFFLAQSRKHWLPTGNRQTQAHLALALSRFAAAGSRQDPTPKAILASLRERSVSNEEMGMFWRDTELSWWWYHAPIETQALMIEAFDEVARDPKAVEDCKVWLLKQKQTQNWKTTKATADAVYALLLKGKDILSSDALVQLQLGGIDLTPGKARSVKKQGTQQAPVEAGTGFYEVRFAPADIKPKLGNIVVKKTDPGVAWGSVHWQYLEDMSKVTPHAGTPLKLKKSLYIKTNTDRGQVLQPIKGPLAVGNELVVRIELRTDRDLEYVHLKDQRGSGTEPVNVLSHYKYQDGLAYYESTRDTASHFFIDYLPKGVYVFEYSTRVQLRGEYQTGVAEIQCMYAPEFNSHSESLPLKVQ